MVIHKELIRFCMCFIERCNVKIILPLVSSAETLKLVNFQIYFRPDEVLEGGTKCFDAFVYASFRKVTLQCSIEFCSLH